MPYSPSPHLPQGISFHYKKRDKAVQNLRTVKFYQNLGKALIFTIKPGTSLASRYSQGRNSGRENGQNVFKKALTRALSEGGLDLRGVAKAGNRGFRSWDPAGVSFQTARTRGAASDRPR